MQSLRSASASISGPGGWGAQLAGMILLGAASGCAAGSPASQQAAPVVAIAQEPHARSRPAPTSEARAPGDKRARRALLWETDEREARARAQREGALLIVHLWSAWSAGSLAMEREVWSDPRIALHPAPVVALRIDLTDAGPDAELWAERYGARAVPTTLLLDVRDEDRGKERELGRLEGQVSAEEVLRALENAANEMR